jgi:hypothetical protein
MTITLDDLRHLQAAIDNASAETDKLEQIYIAAHRDYRGKLTEYNQLVAIYNDKARQFKRETRSLLNN